MVDKITKSEEEWQNQLNPEEYRVTREKGTEQAFSGQYWNHKEKGTYLCKCCGEFLFSSHAKFDSGSGWPSYYEPIDKASIAEHKDDSHGMNRTEVRCRRCDAHLGHVFSDGPVPSGLRYCINSVSLQFSKEK